MPALCQPRISNWKVSLNRDVLFRLCQPVHARYGLYRVCKTTETSAHHSQPHWSPHAAGAPTACIHLGTQTRPPRQVGLARPLHVAALHITGPFTHVRFRPNGLSRIHLTIERK